MTLREYYAGMAMAGIIAAHAGPEERLPSDDFLAKTAVGYADALLDALRERSRP